jgi:hypothetical protein
VRLIAWASADAVLMRRRDDMTLKFVRGMVPLFVLCCILATFVTVDILGRPVSISLLMLNGAGIVLALFHGLEF